jgi:tetratricopeptide (TPR) repeat protein
MQARLKYPELEAGLLEAFVNVQSSQHIFQLVQQHPHLLTDAWLHLIKDLLCIQQNETIRVQLSERLDSLKQMRQEMEQETQEASLVANVVIAFANADWNQRYQMLIGQQTALLSEEIEPVFDWLVAANEEANAREMLEKVRTLLRRCRIWGVDAVLYFARSMRLGDDIPIPTAEEPVIMHIAALLVQKNDNKAALEQAIEDMETLLARQTAGVPPLFEAALLRDLAENLSLLPAGHPTRRLEQIKAYYQEAVPLYQQADRPLSVAFTQRSLGDILLEQECYEEALEPLQTAGLSLQSLNHMWDAAWAVSAFAGALDALDRSEEALHAYTQAIELLPDIPPLLRNHAESLINARRLDEAEADLAHSVELDGNEESAHLWQRRAQLALARGNGTLARQMLEEALKRDASLDVVSLQAQSAWLCGTPVEARAKLRQAWQSATAGGQVTLRREWHRLAADHRELPDLFAELLSETSGA